MQIGRGVPASAVEQQNRMHTSGHGAADLLTMQWHGARLGMGHGQCRTRASGRADGAKRRGALIALIRGLTQARSAPGPLAHGSGLLADARLVLEPNLDRFAPESIGQVRLQRLAKVFLNSDTTHAS